MKKLSILFLAVVMVSIVGCSSGEDEFLKAEKYYDNNNKQAAFEWYLESAEKGFTEAQVKVGYMYKDGKGTSKDYQKSVIWFKKAAKKGHLKAQEELAQLYTFIDETADKEKALKWINIYIENPKASKDQKNNAKLLLHTIKALTPEE